MTTDYEHGAEAPEHEELELPPSYAYEAGMGFAMLMEQNAKLREALAEREGFDTGQRRLYDGIARAAEAVGAMLAGGLLGDSLLDLVGRFVPGMNPPGAGAERHPSDCPGCGSPEGVPVDQVPAGAVLQIPERIALRLGLIPVRMLSGVQFAKALEDGIVIAAPVDGTGGYVPSTWVSRWVDAPSSESEAASE